MAGLAQVVFQLSIVAPVFWMARAVRTEARLARLLWIVFASSAPSSVVGVLQVYYPETFLPPEFSALGLEMNPDIVSSLTYRGADGREIVRPPGLSDMPGGAAVAAMLTMVLGLSCWPSATRRRSSCARCCLAAAVVGMTALLLTQVRSLTLVAAASVGVFAVLRLRQGRPVERGEPGRRRSAGRGRLHLGGGGWRRCRCPTGSRGLVDDGVVRDLSGGARRVPDLHAVGAAVRVSPRGRPRPLGHDARVLRRPDACGRRRPSTSRFSRPAGCSTAAFRCGWRWAAPSSRGCGPATAWRCAPTGSLQESATAILCLQIVAADDVSDRPGLQHAARHPVLGVHGRPVGPAVRRRGTTGTARGACIGDG